MKAKIQKYLKRTRCISHLIMLPLFLLLLNSCSDDDNNVAATPVDENADVSVKSETMAASSFKYKRFYQETANASTRKGIVILAHGDGGDENDSTLNDQCKSLAQNGYVAVTTSYNSIGVANQEQANQRFKGQINEVIEDLTTIFDIPRNKIVIGGLSRGGNNSFALVLPGQLGITPIEGIKGVILECSGGDTWKGSAILYPVAYMSTLNDDVMGSNADEFKNGLTENNNQGVAATSECLIIPGTGHCTQAGQYKAFVVAKVKQWLP